MPDFTDNLVPQLIINKLSQEKYDSLVQSGGIQPDQLYLTPSSTSGLTEVSHDTSLTGTGTANSPLSVSTSFVGNAITTNTTITTLQSDVQTAQTTADTANGDATRALGEISDLNEVVLKDESFGSGGRIAGTMWCATEAEAIEKSATYQDLLCFFPASNQ